VRAEVFTSKGRYSKATIIRVPRGRLFLQHFSEVIESAARTHGVEQSLIRAVIHAESAFNPRAVSPKGALGLMQLMPETARMYGVRRSFEPSENIDAGVRHLAMLERRFRGNLRLMLAAYNAGEGAVAQYGGVPPFSETQQYVERVISLMHRYREAAASTRQKSEEKSAQGSSVTQSSVPVRGTRAGRPKD
jgi:soluble lytic murein transglycosylase-like protein